MTLSIAIQMDPLTTVKYATDSTLRLGLEAQRRGHALWVYTPDKLTQRGHEITAATQRVTFHNNPDHMFDVHESQRLDLNEMDVILLRQDPPFDMAYLSTTYMLERLKQSVLVTNNPVSVRSHPEKLFPMVFSQFMPPTLVTADQDEIFAFRREFKDIVIKPLYGYAGHDVRHVAPDDSFALEAMREPVMVQPFLPEVRTGDRRIILIDGEIGGIMARIPAADDFRANFRVGGHAEKAVMTPRQQEICEALKPELKRLGIVFAGIDCIGDYLTEINITSPTGIAAMNRLYGLMLESDIWDAIEEKL